MHKQAYRGTAVKGVCVCVYLYMYICGDQVESEDLLAQSTLLQRGSDLVWRFMLELGLG